MATKKDRRTRRLYLGEDDKFESTLKTVRELRELRRTVEAELEKAEATMKEELAPYRDGQDRIIAGGEGVDIVKSTRKSISGEKLLMLGVEVDVIKEATTETQIESLKMVPQDEIDD